MRGANAAPIPLPWIFRKNLNCQTEGNIPNNKTKKLLLYPEHEEQFAKIFSNVLKVSFKAHFLIPLDQSWDPGNIHVIILWSDTIWYELLTSLNKKKYMS